jgi:hypothetical protein
VTRLWHRYRRRNSRGQALVEMAMILPIFLLLVLGTLEFGLAFDHNLTLEYATREGARTGSALANGGGPLGCGAGQSPNAATVDNNIIAAVERVLTSQGSPVKMANVTEIRIYWVDNNPTGGINTNGAETPGTVNRWIPGFTAATGNSPALDFQPDPGVQGWPACSRTNGLNADSIGVSVRYNYNLQTSLGALLSVVNFQMRDHTVMALNPTGK